MGNFRIGWSEVNITPEKKISLVGQFAERISEYVEKPLTATAMAVSTDTEQLVMCSCDLVSVSHTLLETVREKLQNNGAGLDPMKVVLSAIHTHTGPGYAGAAIPPPSSRPARPLPSGRCWKASCRRTRQSSAA